MISRALVAMALRSDFTLDAPSMGGRPATVARWGKIVVDLGQGRARYRWWHCRSTGTHRGGIIGATDEVNPFRRVKILACNGIALMPMRALCLQMGRADLLIMGGYSHWPIRTESIAFGGHD
jgi:hypothetical protein